MTQIEPGDFMDLPEQANSHLRPRRWHEIHFSHTWPYFLAIPIWLALVLEWVRAARNAVAAVGAGSDLQPLYDVGHAILHGQAAYNVPNFVYPPPAALVSVPLSLLSYRTIVHFGTYVEAACILLAVVGACRLSIRTAWWLPVGGVLSIATLTSDMA